MKTIRILALATLVTLLGAGCLEIAPLAPQTAPKPVPQSSSAAELDLSGSGLKRVPAYVFDQTQLEVLDVSDNNLNGALQGEIRFLQNLRVLDASENDMTGVPAEIGQLSKLEVLDVSNNQLTGLPLELGNLTSLRLLDLRGNNISTQDLNSIRERLTETEILVDETT